MRSQALRETTSPPRTPSESRPLTTSITTVVVNNAHMNNSTNVSPIPPGSLSPTPSAHRNPSPKSTQVSTGCASPLDTHPTPSFLDHEFPRLAQPKSKPTRNAGSAGTIRPIPTSASESKTNNFNNTSSSLLIHTIILEKPHLLEVSPQGNTTRFASASLLDKDNRGSTDGDENSGDGSPPEAMFRDRSERSSGGVANKKSSQRGGLFVKGSKPRLKSMGSSHSTDEVNSSGFISRGWLC